eukprot:6200705-Pleurochrysis_carterae.AAC.1
MKRPASFLGCVLPSGCQDRGKSRHGGARGSPCAGRDVVAQFALAEGRAQRVAAVRAVPRRLATLASLCGDRDPPPLPWPTDATPPTYAANPTNAPILTMACAR